jgi:hypothetical protein
VEVEKDYQIRMESKLAELSARIGELKKQAEKLDSEKEEGLRQELTKMEAQIEATRKKLQELKRGEYEAQRILRTYLEHSLDELNSYLDINVLPYF